ncbi:MAG: sulfatase-like hydrolase/transferase [Bacteroidota bacterium]
MTKSLDDAVGKIMKTLDEEKLSNKTIVIFTNDNGGERYSDNGGLAKAKGTLWEGGIRVPAFVKWPGKITAGSITQQAAITMDWTKTILSASDSSIAAFCQTSLFCTLFKFLRKVGVIRFVYNWFVISSFRS